MALRAEGDYIQPMLRFVPFMVVVFFRGLFTGTVNRFWPWDFPALDCVIQYLPRFYSFGEFRPFLFTPSFLGFFSLLSLSVALFIGSDTVFTGTVVAVLFRPILVKLRSWVESLALWTSFCIHFRSYPLVKIKSVAFFAYLGVFILALGFNFKLQLKDTTFARAVRRIRSRISCIS